MSSPIPAEDAMRLRIPTLSDAPAMRRLAQLAAGGLDSYATYLYLLLCRDFAATCAVATNARDDDRDLQGFVTAFRPPERPETLFVWQIGVAPEARGQGLAKRMLLHALASPACAGVRYVEANVSPSNVASNRTFASLAKELGAALEIQEGFRSVDFGTEAHEEEKLVRVGPISSPPKEV
jgi:L-2,4-diaminobutyric acid acetyltransferase